MTVISIAIVTNYGLLNSVKEAISPKDAVLQFLDELELLDGELIAQVVCSTLKDNHQFEIDVEKLLYFAIPEKFYPDYVWVESVLEGESVADV